MQVTLKRVVEFNGIRYGIGQHEMPDDLESDWYFKALQADGDAIVIETEAQPVGLSVVEKDLEQTDEPEPGIKKPAPKKPGRKGK